MTEHPAVWDVYVLEYARSKDQPWVDLISGMYQDGAMDLPFSFILARQGDRNVLVDTGFMQDDHGPASRESSASRPGFRRCACSRRSASRRRRSPTSSSPTRISTTWARSPSSPNAHIYIQKSELLSWYEAIALPKRFGHLTAIIDPDNLRTALEASIEHRVTLVDGDKDNVLPGIHVRLGSGHTIGQQFVIVETAAGRRVISGDCVYSRRQFTGHNNDGVYVPLNNAMGSVWEQLKTIDKMNDELGGDLSKLVVLHDIERWKGHQVVKEVEGFRIVRIG